MSLRMLKAKFGSSKTPTFEKKYEIKEKLGAGQFAEVYLAISKDKKKDDREYAVKVILKSKLTTTADIEGLEQEIKILQNVSHDGIIKLFDVFETADKWYLVTELARGGELFDRIVEKTQNGRYSEQEAAVIVMQIAESLKYCHDLNIVHRDLKPENLLLEDKAEDSRVKLADFGFAAYCQQPLNDGCGTLVYVAPEVLRGDPYKTSPDMWSLGVITYILLCGYPPFFHQEQDELIKKIVRGKFRFRPEDWSHVSEMAKDFVRGLLRRQPENRMTADDVLSHPWITDYAKLSSAGLNINENLRKFKAQMLLKRAMFMLRAVDGFAKVLEDFDAEAGGDEEDDEGI